jgi:hypothetical protein
MNSSSSNNSNKTTINYSLFPEEEQEIYNFIRRLSIKYNINSSFMTKQILISLINKTLPKNELSEASKIATEIFGCVLGQIIVVIAVGIMFAAMLITLRIRKMVMGLRAVMAV